MRGATKELDDTLVTADEATVAAMHIMNDDLQAAEDGLADGNSSFHKVLHIAQIHSSLRLIDIKENIG